MRKRKDTKKVKTDKLNERIMNREEKETKEEDNEWDKKEDEERGESNNQFHEEVYDK